MAKAPAKKATVKGKSSLSKKAAPSKKPAPAKKAGAVKKSVPPKKAIPAKKPLAAKQAPVKKKPTPAKKAAAITKVAVKKAIAPAAPPKTIAKPQSKQVASKEVGKVSTGKPATLPAPSKVKTAAPESMQPKHKQVMTGSKLPSAETVVRGAVSQPQAKQPLQRPIVVPEHFKKLQLQLEGISEKASTASESDGEKVPTSDLFTDAELALFLEALQSERSKLLDKARAAVDNGNIALDKDEMYDEVDLASATVDQNLTFRLLDRDRKLLNEIDHAISKIHNGDYGLCEGTGEPIPKRRLELRPWCKYSVKYKEQLERLKKSGRGVVDEDEDMFA
ncbi:MAG: TraR/DksA C4-type zinc finger protein [Proteobacteria bacterium]|nr:TraR/DksA C4-type zinc finger protein [Pseudomonadota bacterium]